MDNTTVGRFKLVAALDATDRADAVLEYALDQASRHERADVHLITVCPAGERDVDEARARLSRLAGSELEAFVGDTARARRVRLHVRPGEPADEIVSLVLDVEADLLVLGGTTSGRRKPRLGDVASHVVAQVPCPVLLARVADYERHPLREQQCPACVAVRAETDGERWFCAVHEGEHPLTSTLLLSHSEPALHGGPMW